jgi:hypothetical protein
LRLGRIGAAQRIVDLLGIGSMAVGDDQPDIGWPVPHFPPAPDGDRELRHARARLHRGQDHLHGAQLIRPHGLVLDEDAAVPAELGVAGQVVVKGSQVIA